MADRALNVARVLVAESAAGVHALVSGVADYRIAVIAMILTAQGTLYSTLQDDSTSLVDLYMVAGVPVVMPENNAGWLLCADGENLSISMGGAVAVGGVVVYRLVPSHMEP